MSDGDRSYWDKHAKNYDRSMSLLGRPIPRMVELAAEATRGLVRIPTNSNADSGPTRAGVPATRTPIGAKRRLGELMFSVQAVSV